MYKLLGLCIAIIIPPQTSSIHNLLWHKTVIVGISLLPYLWHGARQRRERQARKVRAESCDSAVVVVQWAALLRILYCAMLSGVSQQHFVRLLLWAFTAQLHSLTCSTPTKAVYIAQSRIMQEWTVNLQHELCMSMDDINRLLTLILSCYPATELTRQNYSRSATCWGANSTAGNYYARNRGGKSQRSTPGDGSMGFSWPPTCSALRAMSVD